MKTRFQLTLTADRGTRMLAHPERDRIVYRDGLLSLANVLVANQVRHDVVAAARANVKSGYYAQAHVEDVALRDILKSGVVAAVDLDDITPVPLTPTPVLPDTEAGEAGEREYGVEWDGGL